MPRPVSVCRRSASTLVMVLCLGPTARLLIGSEPGHVMVDTKRRTTDADPSNRDSNKGIVSNVYEPYPELLHRMRGINVRKHELIEHFDAKAR